MRNLWHILVALKTFIAKPITDRYTYRFWEISANRIALNLQHYVPQNLAKIVFIHHISISSEMLISIAFADFDHTLNQRCPIYQRANFCLC